jgi:uncharacterized Zn finger protein
MKQSLIVFLINDAVRAIKGRYEEGGNETVFKTLDQDIKVDDFVVVQSGTRHGMTVVKVTAVDIDVDLESNIEMLWAVQKIDTVSFGVTLEQEAKAIAAVNAAEKQRKKDELRKSLFANHEATIAALEIANHTDEPVTE